MSFSEDQHKAASSFAYTMIVVDDEPIREIAEPEEPIIELKTPGRGHGLTGTPAVEKPVAKPSHPLDAKGLTKSAMELGLVCSVVNPTGDEKTIAKSVANASLRADIVSLDWHMNHDDDGDLATDIIKEILRTDEEIGGRLRLIAIYTGNSKKDEILSAIEERLNLSPEIAFDLKKDGDVLTNSAGLRVVWREKSLGNEKLPDAISEKQLPKDLLREFAELSSGLLSNVALATISSMRDTTHHVLSKFSSELDGPFFHHRALLQNTKDSMDYAVSVVMSTLKSEVNKSNIAEKFTTIDAIKRRLEAIGKEDYILRYQKDEHEKQFHFSLDEVLEIIESEDGKWPSELLQVAKARPENAQNAKPTNAHFKSDFSSVFSGSKDEANKAMMRFSFLTNSSSSELSAVRRKVLPKLELGSVLFSKKYDYLLCLQATCDAVRGDGLFFFVPLDKASSSPDVVVPHVDGDKSVSYIGLSIPQKCYTKSLTLNFGKIEDKVGRVPIVFDEADSSFKVFDAAKNEFRWLANLKYKRALRIAQDVGHQMSRIGFDEFEPFK